MVIFSSYQDDHDDHILKLPTPAHEPRLPRFARWRQRHWELCSPGVCLISKGQKSYKLLEKLMISTIPNEDKIKMMWWLKNSPHATPLPAQSGGVPSCGEISAGRRKSFKNKNKRKEKCWVWCFTWSWGQSSSPVDRRTPVTMSWTYLVNNIAIIKVLYCRHQSQTSVEVWILPPKWE